MIRLTLKHILNQHEELVPAVVVEDFDEGGWRFVATMPSRDDHSHSLRFIAELLSRYGEEAVIADFRRCVEDSRKAPRCGCGCAVVAVDYEPFAG